MFPGRPQSFRYQRGWRRTAEQGAVRLMAEWTAQEKVRAGLWHAAVCPNVTERAKERIVQSTRTLAGSFAIVLISHKCRELGILQTFLFFWFVEAMLHFSGVFVSFLSFCFHRTRDPLFSRSSICMRPSRHTELPNNCLRPFRFRLFLFL